MLLLLPSITSPCRHLPLHPDSTGTCTQELPPPKMTGGSRATSLSCPPLTLRQPGYRYSVVQGPEGHT